MDQVWQEDQIEAVASKPSILTAYGSMLPEWGYSEHSCQLLFSSCRQTKARCFCQWFHGFNYVLPAFAEGIKGVEISFSHDLVVLFDPQQSKSSRSAFRKYFQAYLIMMLKYEGVVDTPFRLIPKELTAFSMQLHQHRFTPLSVGCAHIDLCKGRKKGKTLFWRRYSR